MTSPIDLINTLPEGKDTIQHLAIAMLQEEIKDLKAKLAVYEKMHRHPTLAICGITSDMAWRPLLPATVDKIISEALKNGTAPRLM